MPQVSAYSPSHITGFFEIQDDLPEAKQRGSLGAGVSLAKGVRTDVSIKKTRNEKISIRINGRLTRKAGVSEWVTREFLRLADSKYSIEVGHNFNVPIGTGLGTSGAGALSLSLALNEALNTGLTSVEASQIAHQAEIESKTGLGTVIAETYGGVEIRLRPGAPGVGRIMKIPFEHDLRILALSLGPISTTHVLSTPWMRARINGHAHRMLWDLVEEPSTLNLLELSRAFSDGVGLSTPGVRALISFFDQLRIHSSMLMMGEGVFAFLPQSEEPEVLDRLREQMPSQAMLVSSTIATKGAHVLDS